MGSIRYDGVPELQPVSDDFPSGEVLSDQVSTGAVMTFTFSADVQTFWVYAVDPTNLDTDGEVRVQPYAAGVAPSAGYGWPVRYGSGWPVQAITGSVRVYAASGIRVTVYGNRR